jgi:hypothetical protein
MLKLVTFEFVAKQTGYRILALHLTKITGFLYMTCFGKCDLPTGKGPVSSLQKNGRKRV